MLYFVKGQMSNFNMDVVSYLNYRNPTYRIVTISNFHHIAVISRSKYQNILGPQFFIFKSIMLSKMRVYFDQIRT